jgi:hypothetical protein
VASVQKHKSIQEINWIYIPELYKFGLQYNTNHYETNPYNTSPVIRIYPINFTILTGWMCIIHHYIATRWNVINPIYKRVRGHLKTGIL